MRCECCSIGRESGCIHIRPRPRTISRAGRDVIVTTPTASGKTLVYNLPVLERFAQDPDARALYIFPLKALAQDQKAAFERLCLPWPEDAAPAPPFTTAT